MKVPIVILHGWGANSSAWQTPKKLLEKMGFSVFIPDLPGFGKEPPPKTVWSVSDYVDFVLKFAKGKNLEKFLLIGHSFGGRIAIKLAADYPEKLTALVLAGAPGARFSSNWEKIKVWLFLPLAKAGNLCFNIPPFIALKPLARKILYRLAGARDYYYADTPQIRETFKRIIDEDLKPLLKKIKSPTFIFRGERDRVVPPAYANLMFKEMPHAKIKIVKNGTHCFPYEQPKVFIESVVEFLNTL